MNNELFTIKPSLRQYYGRTITKETEFDEYTDDKTVHQTLKDLILTTEINKENEYDGSICIIYIRINSNNTRRNDFNLERDRWLYYS